MNNIENTTYLSSFKFTYGKLPDGTIWIHPPTGKLFRINHLSLQVVLELNRGLSIEETKKKYHLSKEEIQTLIKRFMLEKAIVNKGEGSIVFQPSREDVSLKGFIAILIILIILQIEYFNLYASTFFLRYWYEALIVILISLLAILFHELAHYLAARRYFKPKFGFCLIFIFPALYVNTQEAWTLPKNIRLLINTAGILSDFVINTLAITLAINYPKLEYFVTPFLITQYTRLSVVINPLFSTDGYWILSDITNTVNLNKLAMQNLKNFKINPYSLFALISLCVYGISLIGLLWLGFNLFNNIVDKMLQLW